MATGFMRAAALCEAFGLPLSGLPAWLLWRAYYLMRMPTLGRKLRIWVEWTWGLVFPLDITHLRFTRTGEAVEDGTAIAAPQPRSHPHPQPIPVASPDTSSDASLTR